MLLSSANSFISVKLNHVHRVFILPIISLCEELTVSGWLYLIDSILNKSYHSQKSYTHNLLTAKWSWLTNIPDILMLRLHVVTPLPCPQWDMSQAAPP